MTPSETRVVRVGSREYLRVGVSLIAVDHIHAVNSVEGGGYRLVVGPNYVHIDVSDKMAVSFKEFIEAL